MSISSSSVRAFPSPVRLEAPAPEVSAIVAVVSEPAGPPLPTATDSLRTSGDAELAQNYAKALLGFTGAKVNDNAIMVDVPPGSTFGQWWTQLGNAAQSRDFVEWRRYVRALPGSIEILPKTGQISYKVAPDVSLTASMQKRGSEDPRWSAARAPLVDAGLVISDKNMPFPLPSPESPDRAPAWLVGRFYFEQQQNTALEFQQRSAELEQEKTFGLLDPAHFPGVQEQRSEDALDNQKVALGNINNRHDVAVSLKHLASVLETGNLEVSEIPKYLRDTTFTVHPDSSYERDRGLSEGEAVSLQDFLEYHGFDSPVTAEDAQNLRSLLLAPAPRSPIYGNYGGATSWPRPLDEGAQRQLSAFLLYGDVGNLNLASTRCVLESLMRGIAFEPSELRNPQQVLDRIIQSPKGQALGEAIKARFDALSVSGSANDWLMAALNLQWHDAPEAARSALPAKHVDGFDLAGQQLKGQPLSKTAQSVADYLYFQTRRASTPEKALIQAHLLLASRAPELLVKDIPPTVTHGSIAHVNFSIAVARIEAEAPGRAATMTYGEIMLNAQIQPVSAAQRQIEYIAHHEALKEWGITNSIVTQVTSPEDMNTVAQAYNEQLIELRHASEAQSAPVPASRREIALAELRKVLGDDVRLELKCIVLATYDKDRPGPYSILDLYIEGMLQNPPMRPYHPRLPDRTKTPNSWVLEPYTPPSRGPGRSEANTPNFTIDGVLSKTQSLRDVNQQFHVEFAQFGQALDKSVATQVKNLIAQLPLEDRKNIEYGSLSLFREFKGATRVGQGQMIFRAMSAGNPVLLKVVRDGVSHTYEVNVQKNTLEKRRDLGDFQPGYQPGLGIEGGERRNINTPYTDMVPVTLSIRDESKPNQREQLAHAKTDTGGPLNSFSSPRTSAIGATVAKVTSFWQALETEARGVTTVESEVPFYKKFNEFVLNLIPLRSAIKNFTDGNIGEGIVDLSLDIFGILTAGANVVGKAAKVANGTLSAGGKALRITKTLGRGTLSLINPLDGATDLLRGAGRGARNVARHIIADVGQDIRQLRGARTSYDMVSASKQFDRASIGTFKLDSDFAEGAAVFKNNNWYAYNPITRQPYGPALNDFLPSARLEAGSFATWATASDGRRKIEDSLIENWGKKVAKHRNGPESADFDEGYNTGTLQSVKGLSSAKSIKDLMELANKQTLTAKQLGTLVRKYDDIAYAFGRKASARFISVIEPGFGKVVPIPQVIYLSQTAQLSDGQCAALSRAMASAIEQGKEKVLIRNMYTAAAFPKAPASRQFMKALNKLQIQVGPKTAFHAGKSTRQLSYQDMANELANSTVSKSIMIDSPRHAMAAGIKIEGTEKSFYFYDPNLGIATFSSADAMEAGLKKLFHDKKLGASYRTHSNDRNKLEFKVFDHDDEWQVKNSVFSPELKKLYDAPITSS